MKKFYLLALLVVMALTVSACGKNKQEMMDELKADGYFHYTNEEMSFGMNLPRQFIYYQTQSKTTDNFKDIEVYVPTTDSASYDPNVNGYVKVFTVRIFNEKYWKDGMNDQERADYSKIGVKKDKVYTMLFWEKPSADWTPKWSEEMKKDLIEKFELSK
jgi:hypothetical protein